MPLDDAEKLVDVIIGGAREEVTMEKTLAQIHEEIMQEAARKKTRVDEDELTRRIHAAMSSKSKPPKNKILEQYYHLIILV